MIQLYARKKNEITLVDENSGGDIDYTFDIYSGTDVEFVDIDSVESIHFYNNGAVIVNTTLLQIGNPYVIEFDLTVNYGGGFSGYILIKGENTVNLVYKTFNYLSSGHHVINLEDQLLNLNSDNEPIYFYISMNRDVTIQNFSVTQGTLIEDDGNIVGISNFNYIELDTNIDLDLSINRSLKEITQPNSVKGEYTQPFELPVTNKNAIFFEYLNNNDSLCSSFNTNQNISAYLTYNGINLMAGYIQLLGVITKSNGSKWFKIIFYGNNLEFFTKLKTTDIHETDCSDLPITYDKDIINDFISTYEDASTFESENINNAWAFLDRGEQNNLIGTMPFVRTALTKSYSGVGGALCDVFTPSIRAKYLFEKIHEYHGYTISGSILDDEIFQQMMVPLTKEIAWSKNKTRDDFNFKYITPTLNYNKTTILNTPYPSETFDIFYNLNSYYRPTEELRTSTNWKVNFTGTLDPGGSYPYSYNMKFTFQFFQEGYWRNLNVIEKTVGEFIDEDGPIGETQELDFNLDFTTGLIHYYRNGEIEDVGYRLMIEIIDYNSDGTISNISQELDLNINIEITDGDKEILHPKVIDNPAEYIGGDLTQMDYVKSIINLFNLYPQVDDVSKNVKYDSIQELNELDFIDLTNNIMLDKQIEKKFLNDLIKKETKFNFSLHEEPTSIYSVESETYGEPGGETIINNNNYVSGTVSIETKNTFIYNTTLEWFENINTSESAGYFDVAGYRNKYTLPIRNDDDDLLFLFYSSREFTTPLVPGSYPWYPLRNGDDINNYVEVKHLSTYKNSIDDSVNPFRASFGTPEFTRKTVESIYLNTEYDTFLTNYWNDYIKTISSNNAYQLKLSIILSPLDYINLKETPRVRIGNELYLINKITNFKPYKPTIIELIKLQTSSTKLIINQNSRIVPTDLNQEINYNVIKSSTSLVNKSFDVNEIGSNNVMDYLISSTIIGDYNKIEKSSNIINIGSNNTVEGSNNINIKANSVTVINSQGLIITEDNTTYINNQKISSSGVISENRINDGGLDVLQIPFTDAKLKDSGLDSIYDVDWLKSYVVKNGGLDTI